MHAAESAKTFEELEADDEERFRLENLTDRDPLKAYKEEDKPDESHIYYKF